MKLVDDSERVKEIAAVSPAFSEETSEEMAMVGGVLSAAGLIKLRPKLVIRASVMELAPTEPTTNALFANSSSILFKSFADVCADALPVTVSVAVVADARVTEVVRPLGTFVAVWVIASPSEPAKTVVPGLLSVIVAD